MKYISCKYLEHGIHFFHTKIQSCCFGVHEGGGQLALIDNYAGEQIDWENFFEIKRRMRDSHRNGTITPSCKAVLFLKKKIGMKKIILTTYNLITGLIATANVFIAF